MVFRADVKNAEELNFETIKKLLASRRRIKRSIWGPESSSSFYNRQSASLIGVPNQIWYAPAFSSSNGAAKFALYTTHLSSHHQRVLPRNWQRDDISLVGWTTCECPLGYCGWSHRAALCRDRVHWQFFQRDIPDRMPNCFYPVPLSRLHLGIHAALEPTCCIENWCRHWERYKWAAEHHNT